VLDHVRIRASDRVASERFYETTLQTLGIQQDSSRADFALWQDFSLGAGASQDEVTRRLHLGFAAPSRRHVDEYWRAGVAAGYRNDGPPGPRPQYREEYYGAFLLDPDGNSAEAVHHDLLRRGGIIDHLWIRVADVAAARSFYETVAPHAGLRLRRDFPERAQFAHGTRHGGSFSLVAGLPTRRLHMAFAAPDNAAVDAFHGTALAAGYEGNGAPGERPHYHRGYYSAFFLDPDGNDIGLVNHNRGR
jgi:catechol 2,3-dioxygenase-like lactoylglutathione lyase family enzyme